MDTSSNNKIMKDLVFDKFYFKGYVLVAKKPIVFSPKWDHESKAFCIKRADMALHSFGYDEYSLVAEIYSDMKYVWEDIAMGNARKMDDKCKEIRKTLREMFKENGWE